MVRAGESSRRAGRGARLRREAATRSSAGTATGDGDAGPVGGRVPLADERRSAGPRNAWAISEPAFAARPRDLELRCQPG